jgi:predicted small secreted protein
MRTFRSLAFFLALFSFLVTGCTSSRNDGESSSDLGNAELVVPQVESTYENFQACNEHAQPKDFVAPGSGMNATISFYTQLSNASTEALSRLFALVALRASEMAP